MNELTFMGGAVERHSPASLNGPQPGHGLGPVEDDWAAIEVWLRSVARNGKNKNGSHQTVDTYRYHLAKLRWYCETEIGRTPSYWSAQDAEKFADYLADLPDSAKCALGACIGEDGYTPFRKAPSDNARSDILRFTKAMFTALHGTGYIRLNPMKLMKVSKERRLDKRRAVDGDLFDLVLQVMDESPRETPAQELMYWRDRFIFICLRESGLRASELVGAKMCALEAQYDPKSCNTYWILRVEATTAKGGHGRTVPVSTLLLDALTAYRAAFGLDPFPAERESYGLILSMRTRKRENGAREKNTQDRRYFMSWRDVGTRYGLHAIIKGRVRDAVTLLEQADDKAAAIHLGKVSAHWLRHTFAMTQLLNGQDLRTVATSLGHKNVTTTMVYTEQDALDQIRRWEAERPGSVARVPRVINDRDGSGAE